MRQRIPIVGLLAGLAVVGATSGRAQMGDITCEDSQTLGRQLAGVFGAERLGWGLRDPDAVLEFWVVERTGEWMMVQRYANGTSCVVALGEAWQPSLPDAGPTGTSSKG